MNSDGELESGGLNFTAITVHYPLPIADLLGDLLLFDGDDDLDFDCDSFLGETP